MSGTILLLGVVAAVVAVLSPTMSHRTVSIIMVVSFTLPLTQVASSSLLTDGPRLYAAGIAVLRILTRPGRHRKYSVAAGRWGPLLVIGTGVSMATLVWSEDPRLTIQSTLALAAAALVVWVVSAESGEAFRTAQVVVLALVGVSALSIVTDWAWEVERFRGVFRNANTLGIYLAMAAVLCLRSRSTRLVVPPLLILLVLTGSRAGAIGFAAGFIVYRSALLRRAQVSPAGVFRTLAYIAAVALVIILIPVEALPWRTYDTREGVWAEATAVVVDNLLVGVGAGALASESGSSPIRVLAELGIVGISLVLVGVIAGARRGGRLQPTQLSLLVGMGVHSVFEGWFLVGGSGIFLTFLLLTARDEPEVRPSPASARRARRRVRAPGLRPIPHRAV